MGKFQRSWQLLRNSVSVVMQNPKLLLFPAVIGVATIVIFLFFLAPVVLQPTGYSYTQFEHWGAVGRTIFTEDSINSLGTGPGGELHLRPGAIAFVVVIYLVSMFLATFSNVAFLSEILKALQGETPSITRGFRFACSRLKPIATWSLFAGVVGVVIRAIEERLDFIGRWVVGLIGLAWSAACAFVIPVIICEQEANNPITVLKTSAATLRKTWGELVIGYVGLQVGGLLVLLGSMVWWAVAIVLAIALQAFWILAPAAALWVAAMFALIYVSGVAGQVYRCALYVYATTGQVPAPFTAEQMALAWKSKKVKAPKA